MTTNENHHERGDGFEYGPPMWSVCDGTQRTPASRCRSLRAFLRHVLEALRDTTDAIQARRGITIPPARPRVKIAASKLLQLLDGMADVENMEPTALLEAAEVVQASTRAVVAILETPECIREVGPERLELLRLAADAEVLSSRCRKAIGGQADG